MSAKTATTAIEETLPKADRPIQFLHGDDEVRSIHGISYTRLWNSELLDVVGQFDSEFQPPKPAQYHHGTGLYAGEQDMFAFLVDDNAWVDIGEDRFAPGFFVWNSEVGSRSVGIQTFWYQHICGNHIVWDCTDVNEFIGMIKNAAKVVRDDHSAFAWVDALTRNSGLIKFAGARAALDQKIGSLLSCSRNPHGAYSRRRLGKRNQEWKRAQRDDQSPLQRRQRQVVRLQ